MSDTITFALDGTTVTAHPGESIWQVARRTGTHIPHLCHTEMQDYAADGNCRLCMVEIEGRTHARCLVHPPADAGHGRSQCQQSCQGVAPHRA